MNKPENTAAVYSLKVDAQVDLAAFCQLLWKQQLQHRVYTNAEGRFLVVGSEAHMQRVKEMYHDWQSMGLAERERAVAGSEKAWLKNFYNSALVCPVTAIVSIITLLSYVLIFGFNEALIGWFTIAIPVELSNSLRFQPLLQTFYTFEIWRLVSPVFLHFSPLHLVFDLVLLIYFLRRIETALGSWFTLMCFLFIATCSNLVQYQFTSAALFGGLSGVVYGLLGFVIVMQRAFPDVAEWAVNKGFLISMLVFLLLYSTGVTELFNLYIANAAHWAGLITGALLAISVVFRLKNGG